jgi:outer membrane protein
MRWITFLCCLLAVSLAQAKDLKIATVDLQKLFTEYPGTKKAQDKFNALAKKKVDDLGDQKKEIQDLNDDLQKSSSILTKKQRKDKQYILQRKMEDYQAKQGEISNELKAKEGEMTQEILTQVKAIVAGVAKAKGFDLVLDGEKAVYVREGTDLTPEVLKSYKELPSDSADPKGAGDTKK